MAQFPGEFFVNNDEQVRYMASKPRRFEDLTSKEKLELCIWVQKNFDELIAYVRSTQ
jgi:hypothetical protein